MFKLNLKHISEKQRMHKILPGSSLNINERQDTNHQIMIQFHKRGRKTAAFTQSKNYIYRLSQCRGRSYRNNTFQIRNVIRNSHKILNTCVFLRY